MFRIVSDYGQTIMPSRDRYQNIEISHDDTLTRERLANIGIFIGPIDKRQCGKCLFNHSYLSQMSLNRLAVQCAIGEFGDGNFGHINLIDGRCGNMLGHAATMVEIFNPRICIKDKTVHTNLRFKG